MYKICFYVPENTVELVKKAMFDSGAGKIGNYDSCCWQSLGTGQFRALEGSKPTIGYQGEITSVSEYKVELVCDEKYIEAAIKALIESHPYEEPAYDVVKLEDMTSMDGGNAENRPERFQ